MISPSMEKELNDQLNKEFYSAYIYLGMSAFCSKNGLNGAANWFFIQYQEENAHAMKFFKYLGDQNIDVVLSPIAQPKGGYTNLLEAFKASLEHEQKMSEWLNNLSDLAMKEKDHATYTLLQWYVTEQVEEEATFNEIIDKLKLVGDNGYGIFMIDKDLAARVFVDPTI